MKIKFNKYQGTGNDFIIIDNRDNNYNFEINQIIKLCDRKYGIGSDGLILIERDENVDFNMNFYNPDGSKSFCGNGSRCAIKYCIDNKIINSFSTKFLAIDGFHNAEIHENNIIEISLKDIDNYEIIDDDFFINTGSPHYVIFTEEDIDNMDLISIAHKIRYNSRFAEKGTNVNIVNILNNNNLKVRTYERGVENETLSCGTGVVACSIAAGKLMNINNVNVKTKGGNLEVSFEITNNYLKFNKIKLKAEAIKVFEGEIIID